LELIFYVTKKDFGKWPLIVGVVIVAFILFLFFGVTSGPSPATDVSKTSFNCTEWEDTSFQSPSSDGFSILIGSDEYNLLNFDITGKQFHHRSNECDNKGCDYLGEISGKIRLAGNFIERPAGYREDAVVLVDTSDIVYFCLGQDGA
jgi:hypothetical protein